MAQTCDMLTKGVACKQLVKSERENFRKTEFAKSCVMFTYEVACEGLKKSRERKKT